MFLVINWNDIWKRFKLQHYFLKYFKKSLKYWFESYQILAKSQWVLTFKQLNIVPNYVIPPKYMQIVKMLFLCGSR